MPAGNRPRIYRPGGSRPLLQPDYSVQLLNANVLVAYHASGVMTLQREGPVAEFPREVFAGLCTGWLVIFKHSLSIHEHRDAIAFYDYLLRPPFAILCRRIGNIHDAIKTSGLDPIAMGIVDLALEPSPRPIIRLIFGMKVNPAVGMRTGHKVYLEIEIFERPLVAYIEKMAAISVRDERTLFNRPG